MTIQELISLLERAEMELKELLGNTPPAIAVDRNKQDCIANALEEVQGSISSLLRAKAEGTDIPVPDST